MKNYIIIVFLFIFIFISPNIYSKPIKYILNDENKDPIFFVDYIEDYLLNSIKGEVVFNSLDESKGRKPKIYILYEGEATSGTFDNDLPANPIIYMIVWPDGTYDFQVIDPYTGQIYLILYG